MITFNKSQPEPVDLAPERLKASGTYRTEGVLTTLKNDFYNKCYICEYKNPTTINVEHFIPHKNDRHLKFDWDNLFFSCSHCNNIKKEQYDNILNCTLEEDDVENKIKLSISIPFITKKVEVTPLHNDVKTINTAELLKKAYNGTTTMKEIESYYIREALSKDILKFLGLITEYYSVEEPDYKELLKIQIKAELHDSASFTGFKRWIIKEDAILFRDFL